MTEKLSSLVRRDIYDEPINHLLRLSLEESNILQVRWLKTIWLISMANALKRWTIRIKWITVVIRPEKDLRITLPEEGKLQVKVDTQLFRGVHYEIIAYDELGNEWMIPLGLKAIVSVKSLVFGFEPEDILSCVSNETEADARIEKKYVEGEEQEAGLINAIEEERDGKPLTSLSFHIFMDCALY